MTPVFVAEVTTENNITVFVEICVRVLSSTSVIVVRVACVVFSTSVFVVNVVGVVF